MADSTLTSDNSAGAGLGEILASIVPELAGLAEAFELLSPEVMLAATGLGEIAPALAKFEQEIGDTIGPAMFELAEDLNGLLAPIVPIIAESLESLEPVLATLGEWLKALAVGLGFLLNPLGSLKQAFSSVAAKVGEVFTTLGHAIASAATTLGDVTKRAGAALLHFADGLRTVVSSLARGIAVAGAGFVQLSLSMSAANQFLSAAARGLQFFTSSLTAGVGALVNAVSPFVQQLAPGLVNSLNYAMRSLTATIGTALVPVVNVLSSAIRHIAGILLPAMEAIAPAIGSITEALMTFVEGTIRSFADTLVMLTPAFNALAEVSHMLVSAWDAIRAVILATIDTFTAWIKTLFGGTDDMKGVLASFRDGLHQAIAAILRFTTMLAKSLGFSDFQAALVKNLNDLAGKRPGERKSGAAPAAVDAAFRGFEDFAKTVAQSAFIAQGGGGKAADAKSEREWLADLAKSVSEMKEGKTLQQFRVEFQAWIITTVQTYATKAGTWIINAAYNAGSALYATVELKINEVKINGQAWFDLNIRGPLRWEWQKIKNKFFID